MRCVLILLYLSRMSRIQEVLVHEANSRGALTPSNIHWILLGVLNRFTQVSRNEMKKMNAIYSNPLS